MFLNKTVPRFALNGSQSHILISISWFACPISASHEPSQLPSVIASVPHRARTTPSCYLPSPCSSSQGLGLFSFRQGSFNYPLFISAYVNSFQGHVWWHSIDLSDSWLIVAPGAFMLRGGSIKWTKPQPVSLLITKSWHRGIDERPHWHPCFFFEFNIATSCGSWAILPFGCAKIWGTDFHRFCSMTHPVQRNVGW